MFFSQLMDTVSQRDCCVYSDRKNYFWRAGHFVRQGFSALLDILIPCQTFFQVMTIKYQSLLLFTCRTSHVYWTLLDKMSGKVWALCQTSAEVCRTCPACPVYFAITVYRVLAKYSLLFSYADSAQDEDMKTMETSGTIETITVPVDLVGGRLDYPRRVSKVSYSYHMGYEIKY